MELILDPDRYALARLDPRNRTPDPEGRFVSVTRTAHELSLVCPEASLPPGAAAEIGWRRLSVVGPLDLSQVGVLASLTGPLAAARVPVFAVSSYDTDHLLVREAHLERAIRALEEAGHPVTKPI